MAKVTLIKSGNCKDVCIYNTTPIIDYYEKLPRFERFDRWIDYAAACGIKLKHLLIHPDDYTVSLLQYRGLPIKVIHNQSKYAK